MNRKNSLWEELRQLDEKLYQARQNFDEAEPLYIDAAIAELYAAEVLYNTRLREYKSLL